MVFEWGLAEAARRAAMRADNYALSEEGRSVWRDSGRDV